MNNDLICKYALEISELLKKISTLFPKENEYILKHLAASSIHLTMFLRDFSEITLDEKCSKDLTEEEIFLEECGCDMHG